MGCKCSAIAAEPPIICMYQDSEHQENEAILDFAVSMQVHSANSPLAARSEPDATTCVD
jgi:hypothetical protein